MIEIQENKINKEVNFPPEFMDKEWKKYNKRMDNMIDDAEIEAEMEAEKKIRSKNSRLFIISIIGIALLALIYKKVQQHPNIPQTKIEKKRPVKEAVFRPRKIPSFNAQTDQLTSVTSALGIKTTKASAKPDNVAPRVIVGTTLNNKKSVKTSKSVSVKQKFNKPGGKHYVQLGAFSIKKNAQKFAKKVDSKGFKTVINVRDIKSTQFQIFIGSFDEKNNSKIKQAELQASGLNPSIKKVNNVFTLDLGTFRSNKNSNSLVEKLRGKGFKPKIKKVLVENRTYTVRIEGLETENEAKKTRQKLANRGFKNSFIR